MAKRHTIVNLDKVKATGSLESVYFAEETLENGMLDIGVVAQLGKLAEDGESREGVAPKDLESELVLLAPVVMDYNDNLLEEDFYMVAGKKYRGYVLSEGDIITITDEAFDAKPAVNDVLVPKVGSFGYEKGDKESSLKFKVISDVEYLAGYPATVLRVL